MAHRTLWAPWGSRQLGALPYLPMRRFVLVNKVYRFGLSFKWENNIIKFNFGALADAKTDGGGMHHMLDISPEPHLH